MNIIFLKLAILSILTVSCTKEVNYFKDEINQILLSKDSRVEFVLANDFEGKLPSCEQYRGECQNVFGIKLGLLYFIGVEYSSKNEAQKAATKYRGYYYHNWFFDDARGEPALEELMKKLEAQKP